MRTFHTVEDCAEVLDLRGAANFTVQYPCVWDEQFGLKLAWIVRKTVEINTDSANGMDAMDAMGGFLVADWRPKHPHRS